MKFAYVSVVYNIVGNAVYVNIGENIQSYAIYHLYKRMGISDADILEWSSEGGKIVSLSGEKLPENGEEIIFLSSNHSNLYQLPNYVKCISIGYNTFGREIDNEEIKYLKQIEPVGARDEAALTMLHEHGINAWLNGCLSITLPKNKKQGEFVYLIDVPMEILKEIPENIRNKAIVRTQEYYLKKDAHPDFVEDIKALAKKQYLEYQQNASLIITSRLHVASPCLAWGIPVVLIRKNPFITFSWIDKYIPVHSIDEPEKINWNGYTAEIENNKQMILNAVSSLVTEKAYGQKPYLAIDKLYQDRPYKSYYYKTIIEGAWEKIQKKFDNEKGEFKYILWGITFNAEILYNLIQEKYPKGQLTYAIDTYKRIPFHGHITCSPNNVNFDDSYVIVIPTGAVQVAHDFLKDKLCKYKCFVTEKFIQQEDL